MKKESLALSISLLITIMLYLIGSFITASFDITTWAPFGRFTLSFIWVICQCFTVGIYCCMWDEENRKALEELNKVKYEHR